VICVDLGGRPFFSQYRNFDRLDGLLISAAFGLLCGPAVAHAQRREKPVLAEPG
jgi:hypothetical protein